MIAGMAMLTMVTSSRAMNMPRLTTTRIHHLRGWPWSRAARRGGAGMESWSVTGGPLGCRRGVVRLREREPDEGLFEGGRDDLERGLGAGGREDGAHGRQVGARHAQVAADEGGRQAGRAQRRERLVPARGVHGDGRAVADDRRERPLGHDASAGHEDEAVALAGLVQVVRGDEHAGAAGRGAVHGLPQRRARAEPYAGRGLVEDEQVRLVRQGGGEGEAPAQAERQVADEGRRGGGEVRLELRRPRTERLRRERQVLGDGEVLPEAEALGDVPEPRARLARGRAAEQLDAAGGGPQEAEQQPDERRLAGAVRAQQTDDLAGTHLEIHAGDRGEGPEAEHGSAGCGERRRHLAGGARRRPRLRPCGARGLGASRASARSTSPSARPSSSRRIVEARLASSRYVVETTTAAPAAAASAIIPHRSARLTGSTPVVGSSRTSSSGWCSSASANASFWRMPPESRPASRSPVPLRPVRAKSSATRRSRWSRVRS